MLREEQHTLVVYILTCVKMVKCMYDSIYIYISLFLVTFVNTMVYKKQIKVQEYIITKQLYIIFTTGERVTFFSHEGRHFYL